MTKAPMTLAALLALGGCAFQTEAQINAQLARHVGQSETDLVRELGVPARHFDTGGHRFLGYVDGHQEIIPPPGGFGFGYPGGGWGYGYGGWGGWGWGGGWGGWDLPSDIVTYGCETTYEVLHGRVIGFQRHGNAC